MRSGAGLTQLEAGSATAQLADFASHGSPLLPLISDVEVTKSQWKAWEIHGAEMGTA